jgi:hypothetical protein
MLLLEACVGLLPLTYGMASRANSTGPMAEFGRTVGAYLMVLGVGMMWILGWAAVGVGKRRLVAGGVAIMVNGVFTIVAVLDRFASSWAVAAGTLGITCLVILTRPPVRAWVSNDDTT